MRCRISSISVLFIFVLLWMLVSLGPTSAQTATNLVCSKCVGSSDLADGAATRSKIRNFAIDASKMAGSAVVSAKIATGAVTRGKIRDFAVNGSKLAGSAVSTAKLANGAVTGSKIANGAVTAAKIVTNAVTAAKIADGAVTFDKLADDAVFLRTIVVSPVGPASTDNCDELIAVLDDIRTAADAGTPHAVYVEPGDYDCGPSQVIVPGNVSVRGGGIGVTTIRGTIDQASAAFVILNTASELHHLSITHEGGSNSGNNTIAVGVAGTGARASHVNLRAEANAVASFETGLFIADEGFSLSNSVVFGVDEGVLLLDTTAVVTAEIFGSRVSSQAVAVNILEPETMKIVASELDTPDLIACVGTALCAASHNAGFDPLPKTCE